MKVPRSSQDVSIVVQSAGGSQVGNSPDHIVHDGRSQERGEELSVGLFGAPVFSGQQQAVCLVIGKAVDVQQVRSLAVGDTGVDDGVDVVPGNDVNSQVDLGVSFLKLHHEISPPVSGLVAVLGSDHGNFDLAVREKSIKNGGNGVFLGRIEQNWMISQWERFQIAQFSVTIFEDKYIKIGCNRVFYMVYWNKIREK